MRVSGRFGAAIALLAVAIVVGAVGCGETVVDDTKMEEKLARELEIGEIKISSVSCPADIEVEKGTTFACTVKLEGGEEQTAKLEILNDDADVSLIDLSASDPGANK